MPRCRAARSALLSIAAKALRIRGDHRFDYSCSASRHHDGSSDPRWPAAFRSVAQTNAVEQWCERIGIRQLIEVARHDDPMFLEIEALQDRRNALRLFFAFRVVRLIRAVAAAFEVIHQRPEAARSWHIWNSVQSRLNTARVVSGSGSSTWLRMLQIGQRLAIPTSIPRSSLPSITIACG